MKGNIANLFRNCVIYDANNRPTRFTKAGGSVIVENGYDFMGRRYMKKVTENGTVTRNERYLYRGYLQIAALDILHGGKQKHALFWDLTEPLATRPLVLLASDDNRYTYAHDLTKNVTELLDAEGNIAATYDYDPFGTVTATGPAAHLNPIQWSSEVYDAELGLVYYNFRHYNPADGRWINRDPIAERGGWNLYGFVNNQIAFALDRLGLNCLSPENVAKCILVDSSLIIPNATGPGLKEHERRDGYKLFITIRKGFIIRLRAEWKYNDYAEYPRCSCRKVIDQYKKAKYLYGIYASAEVIADDGSKMAIYDDVSRHEGISLLGKYQIDEIRRSNALGGKSGLATLNPGLADFSIKFALHRKFHIARVMAYVESPGKGHVYMYDKTIRYVLTTYYSRSKHFFWEKIYQFN